MGTIVRRLGADLLDKSSAVAVGLGCGLADGLRGRVGILSGWLGVMVLLICPASDAGASQFVQLDYNLTLNARSRDAVFVELFDDRPLTQANFMQYVEAGRFDGSFMHRLSRDFVIQGGGFYPVFVDEPPPVDVSLDPDARVDLDGNPATANPTVPNEYSNSPTRSNLRGTIAMARLGGQPNSATNQWFVNLENNTGLDAVDGGFTVFAQVVGDGMALIDAFNTLSVADLNPDIDDNGTRDGGPFGMNSGDGVPYLQGVSGDLLVILEKAKHIDYFGAGSTTNIPSTGLPLTTRDAFIDTGAVFTGTGTLTIGLDRTLGIREGTNFAHRLVNRGTLALGLQLGAISVQTFQQQSVGTLDIQLRGTTGDTEHDRLVVTGTATLNGKLDVSLLSGFVAEPGDAFTFLTAASIVGDFATIELPLLNQGLVWDITKTATAYSLSVAAADFNRDGMVDAADYVVWRKHRDTSVAPYAAADANGDGLINDADFMIWQANLGNTRGTAAGGGAAAYATSSVPEPATVLLAVAAVAALVVRRRGRLA